MVFGTRSKEIKFMESTAPNNLRYPYIRGHFPKWYDMVSSKIDVGLWDKIYTERLSKFYNIMHNLQTITNFTSVNSIN